VRFAALRLALILQYYRDSLAIGALFAFPALRARVSLAAAEFAKIRFGGFAVASLAKWHRDLQLSLRPGQPAGQVLLVRRIRLRNVLVVIAIRQTAQIEKMPSKLAIQRFMLTV
jgi:hypothetical protein